MKNTTMTVKHAGSVIRTGFKVNIQNMNWQTATEMGGQDPYHSYWIYSLGGGVAGVVLNDTLLDEHETDPLTSQPTKYLVFGNPEQYFSVYEAIPAQKIIGS